eukprot:scaffold20.g7721.t1
MERAERENDPRTVFVRNVAYDVDDEELNAFFSELGPVKQAFLVRRGKGAAAGGRHLGFGFVQYALEEDTRRAVEELAGRELGGRRLKVEGAIKRAPMKERKKRKAAAAPPAEDGGAAAAKGAQPPGEAAQPLSPPPAKKARPAGKAAARPAAAAGSGAAPAGEADPKHRLVRAVAISCPSAGVLGAAQAMARRAGQVEEVVAPLPAEVARKYMLARDGCGPHAFLAVYSSVKQAMDAVAKLHRQPIAATAQQQQDQAPQERRGRKGARAPGAAEAGALLWVRQVSGEGMHLKRWRLVVRNLPFAATEADLHAAFGPAGCVWEATLPRRLDGAPRGFAFVGFTSKAAAERGIRLVNGQRVAGRPVAVDWAVAKAQYDQHPGAEQEGAEHEGAGQRRSGGAEPESSVSEESGGRRAGAQRRAGHESDEDEGGAELAPEQERSMLHSVIAGILDPHEGGAEEGSEGEEEEGSESEGSEGEEEEEEGGEPAAGGDMFSGAALQQRRGAAAAALDRLDRRLALAPSSATPGAARHEPPPPGATVFVRGLPLDVTKDQLFEKMKAFGRVRSCRLVIDKASGKPKGTAFVDFAEPAGAAAAAAACARGRAKAGPGVAVAGRVVDVDQALDQDGARSLALARAGDRPGATKAGGDRRRAELAREGQLEEGSAAWQDMSEGDRAKRRRAAEEKRLKLRSPNFVVSATRLSVRNIPRAWGEAQLKQLFLEAVKARASKERPRVRQAKILRGEGAGAGAGAEGAAPRSKGIGFVEFEDPSHALAALRQLNNNPEPWGKERRPIVEFALDNVKALKAREARAQKQQQLLLQGGAGGPAAPEQAGAPAGATGKGKRRRQEGQQQDGGDERGQQQEAGGEDGAQPLSKRQLRKQVRLMLKQRAEGQRQQQQQAAGGAAAAAPQQDPEQGGSAAKKRAQKRREQRKRSKAAAGEGAPTGAVFGAGAPLALPAPPPAQQQQGKQHQQKQPAPQANSRAAKAAAAAGAEAAARTRKRQADALLDQLAGPQQEGPLRLKKQRKQKGGERDSLDALEERHKRLHYGGSGGGKGASGKVAAAGAAAAAAKAAAKAVAAGRGGLKRCFAPPWTLWLPPANRPNNARRPRLCASGADTRAGPQLHRDAFKIRIRISQLEGPSTGGAERLGPSWPGRLLPPDAAERGTTYGGSRAQLARLARGLLAGRAHSVAVLGGSVSFGRGARTANASYPHVFMRWLADAFPAAHSLKNAAIPASTSGVAAACLEALVPANASLVVLEYSINDIAGLGFGHEQVLGGEKNVLRRAYELLLRKLLAMPSRPAVVMLHHWCHYTAVRGDGTRGAFEQPDTEGDYTLLAQYYDIPALSVRAAALPLMRAGARGFRVDVFGAPSLPEEAQNEFFYIDPCHPTNSGHQVLADLLIHMVQQAALREQRRSGDAASTQPPGNASASVLPPPLQPGVRDVPPGLCLLQWGWQSDTTGDWAELEVDTREGGAGPMQQARRRQGQAGQQGEGAGRQGAARGDSGGDSGDDGGGDAEGGAAEGRGKGKGKQKEKKITVSLGYLRSYRGMGVGESFFDGLWERQLSLVETHQFTATQHPACRIRVTVAAPPAGRDGTRVALKSLAVTQIPLVMGDVQAAEGAQDSSDRR